MYNGKPIFYSLGNFIFDQSNEATHTAYFVEIDLVNDTGICTVYPIYISNYLPQYMSSEDGTSLLSNLSPQCDQLEITANGTGKLAFNLTD
jgi:poly-gamma-glutamate synthesis protein (capsule biosynthesis protein)